MASSSSHAILLVDGYNIIGAWTKLQHMRDTHGLEAARWELVESLVGYSAFQGYRTEIIFDAQYQEAPGSREMVTDSLSICYTDFLQTADSYIEQTCSKFRQDERRFSHRLIVATSDRAQQLTVIGYGAEWISAQRLKAEVESAIYRIRAKQSSKPRASKRLLAHSIDPVARQRLAQLRMGQPD